MKKLIALSFFLSSTAQAAYFNPPPNTFSDFTACGAGCAAQLMADFNQIISNGNTSYASLVAAINALPASTVIPAGAIMMNRYQTLCPAGYAPMNGTGGTADLTGRFVRGWSNGGSVDPGRVRASYQGSQFQDHSHGTSSFLTNTSASYLSALPTGFTTADLINSLAVGLSGTGGASGSGIGSDTFPVYYTLTYCVKT
jgi:hypothetical protein